jgi:hypothetical protein
LEPILVVDVAVGEGAEFGCSKVEVEDSGGRECGGVGCVEVFEGEEDLRGRIIILWWRSVAAQKSKNNV